MAERSCKIKKQFIPGTFGYEEFDNIYNDSNVDKIKSEINKVLKNISVAEICVIFNNIKSNLNK